MRKVILLIIIITILIFSGISCSDFGRFKRIDDTKQLLTEEEIKYLNPKHKEYYIWPSKEQLEQHKVEDLETERMKIIAEQVARASRVDPNNKQDPYWIQKDVRSRKMCIATGQGIVHGATISLNDFDLELTSLVA